MNHDINYHHRNYAVINIIVYSLGCVRTTDVVCDSSKREWEREIEREGEDKNNHNCKTCVPNRSRRLQRH